MKHLLIKTYYKKNSIGMVEFQEVELKKFWNLEEFLKDTDYLSKIIKEIDSEKDYLIITLTIKNKFTKKYIPLGNKIENNSFKYENWMITSKL